ncbi:MAG: GAF domain-containing protein [Acidobacteriota bacterium]
MSNRWVRVFLFLLALAAGAGAVYQAWLDERAILRSRATAESAMRTATRAVSRVGDLRAALHAYVAPGQGQAFWTARAGTLLDEVRADVLELDAAASAVDAPLTDALDGLDRLAATADRAAGHVRDGQALLAGELLFGEARDLLDATRLQVTRAAEAVARSALDAESALRQRQRTLVGTAIGVALLVALLLVPTGRSLAAPTTSERSAGDVARDEASGASSPPLRLDDAAAPPAAPDLAAVAAVCTDLARVSDSGDFQSIVTRAAGVLRASGLIVWVADGEGRALYPAASHGYDPQMFARIGSLPREAQNMTAEAFREAAVRTSEAAGTSRAAVAVPLLGPTGPTGVLSAELEAGASLEPGSVALAAILAAQLATLVGSMPAAEAAPEADRARELGT